MAANPFHYAVVVGVNEYPAISSLNSPTGDAEAFTRWLTDPIGGGLDPANIELVLTPAGAKFQDRFVALPTRREVNEALSRLMAKFELAMKANPTDWERSRLYLYVSGHGISPDAREAALLMANATKDELGESIGCGLYLRRFEDTTQFKEVVVFADCCRSEAPQADPGGPPFNKRKFARGRVKTLLGFATEFQELAFEPPADDTERSYFTKALIEGLNGAATRTETDGTQVIDTVSLRAFMDVRVPELTQAAIQRQQRPLLLDGGTALEFRRFKPQTAAADPRPQRNVTVNLPAGFTHVVTIHGGDSSFPEVARHAPAAGPVVIALFDGLYEARPLGAPSGKGFVGNGLFSVGGEDISVQL